MNQHAIIHIGLPKTATTTLQTCFFKHHPRITYLGKPFADAHLGTIIRSICELDEIEYTSVAERHRRYFRNTLKALSLKGRVIALSNESLSAAMNTDRNLIAQRLKY